MAGNILAIEFKQGVINAGVLAGKAGEPRLFSARAIGDSGDGAGEGDEKDALKNLLREMAGAGVKDIRRVVVGIDPSLVSLRVVETPFFSDRDRQKLAEIIPLELSDALMEDSNNYVFASKRIEGKKALAAAVEKKLIAGYLAVLRENGLEPDWITSPLFLKDFLVKTAWQGNEAAIFIDDDSLVAVKGGSPIFYKAVSGADDVSLAVMSLKADGVEIKRFYMAEGAGIDSDALGVDVDVVSGCLASETGVRSLIRAAADNRPPEMDFRSGEFADAREAEAVKRGLKAACGFALLVVILWGVHFYLMKGVYASETARLDDRMKEAYSALFPEEAGARDFVYRMKAKLKAVDRETAVAAHDARALGVMSALASVDNKETAITGFSITEGRVAVNGTAASRAAAEKMRLGMDETPIFSGAALGEVKDMGEGAAKKVSFVITASIGGAS